MSRKHTLGNIQRLNEARLRRIEKRSGLRPTSGRVSLAGHPVIVANAIRQLAIELNTPRENAPGVQHLDACEWIECGYCAQGLTCDCGFANGDSDSIGTFECADGCPMAAS
jgi:hypothetical protein